MVVYARILKSTAVGLQSQVQIIPIVIGACVAVGLTVHFALERPILNLIRNFVREKKRLVVPQTKVQAS
jgi:hypothetical protein